MQRELQTVLYNNNLLKLSFFYAENLPDLNFAGILFINYFFKKW